MKTALEQARSFLLKDKIKYYSGLHAIKFEGAVPLFVSPYAVLLDVPAAGVYFIASQSTAAAKEALESVRGKLTGGLLPAILAMDANAVPAAEKLFNVQHYLHCYQYILEDWEKNEEETHRSLQKFDIPIELESGMKIIFKQADPADLHYIKDHLSPQNPLEYYASRARKGRLFGAYRALADSGPEADAGQALAGATVNPAQIAAADSAVLRKTDMPENGVALANRKSLANGDAPANGGKPEEELPELLGVIGFHIEGGAGLLYVRKEYRGLGIGALLEEYIFLKALAAGEIPFGHVETSNTASINLQKKLGLKRQKDIVTWIILK